MDKKAWSRGSPQDRYLLRGDYMKLDQYFVGDGASILPLTFANLKRQPFDRQAAIKHPASAFFLHR